MNGFELMVWRKERKITQEALAKAFDVSRRTVVNWEAGKHRLPIDLASKLEKLAYTLMPKPIDVLPDWIEGAERERRGDLDLYKGKDRGQWIFGYEHPSMLLGDDHPLKRGGSKWPWSTLESPEFVAAVEKWRKTGQNSRLPRERKIMHWIIPKK